MAQSDMPLAICPLASGSKGNAYYLEQGGVSILVDVGLSFKQLSLRLELIGRSINDIDHVFITHEHNDHAKALAVLTKKIKPTIWASRGTLRCLRGVLAEGSKVRMMNGNAESAGGITVNALSVNHDASDPLAYRFDSPSGSVAVVTDLGKWGKETVEFVNKVDIIVCESNHDPDMLQRGPYPFYLKQRITSQKGHLNNEESAMLVLEAVKSGTKHVVLAHLSESNNSPSLAIDVVRNILETQELFPEIFIAQQDEPGPWVKVKRKKISKK